MANNTNDARATTKESAMIQEQTRKNRFGCPAPIPWAIIILIACVWA